MKALPSLVPAIRLLVRCAVVVAGAVSCHREPTGPAPGEAPPPSPLETIDYGALGSGKILFQRFGGSNLTGPPYTTDAVYLIDGDQRRSSVATDLSKDLVMYPAISPRGDALTGLRWTDFVSCYDVYSRSLAAGTWSRLTSETCNYEGAPSWSPDGTGILYLTSFFGRPRWGLYEQRVVGGENYVLRTFSLTGDRIECPDADRAPELGAPVRASTGALAYPCQGTTIVAVGPPPESAVSLFSRSVATSRLYSPAWSPDGSQLAYLEAAVLSSSTSSSVQTVLVKLVIVAYPSGTPRVVATQGGVDVDYAASVSFSACWLASGSGVVFTAPDSGNTDGVRAYASLFVVRADGTGLRRLTASQDAHDNTVTCTR